MAEGLNVDEWGASSPPYAIAGQSDERAMASMDEDIPDSMLYDMGQLPAFNDIGPLGSVPDLDFATTTAAHARAAHPARAAHAPATKRGKHKAAAPVRQTTHWSHLLDVHNNGMAWLGLFFVAYLGLISVQLHARVGGHRGG